MNRSLSTYVLKASDLPYIITDVGRRIVYQHYKSSINIGNEVDYFTFHILDSNGVTSAPGKVYINITPPGNFPKPLSSTFNISSYEDEVMIINLPAMTTLNSFNNSSDEMIYFEIVDLPQNGKLYQVDDNGKVTNNEILIHNTGLHSYQWVSKASASSYWHATGLDSGTFIF